MRLCGEICGLRWSDINWESNTLAVRRQARVVNGLRDEKEETKTAHGMRQVDIPDFLVTKLKEWRARQNTQRLQLGSKWVGGDYVITTKAGKLPNPDSIRKALAEAGCS